MGGGEGEGGQGEEEHTWAHLHGGHGRGQAALGISHPQLEQVGALDQVGQVEGGLVVRPIQDVLQQNPSSTNCSR